MPKQPKNISSDLQSVTKLTVDAVKGVTNIVESMHSTIASYTSIIGDPKKNAKGISGMVYRNIRKITDVFGDGLDVMLGKMADVIGEKQSFRSREAIIAVTNGVIGDYMHQEDNPLAIKMSLRSNGQTLSSVELDEMIKESNGKIALMIHGLCMNDLHWQSEEHNHGEALADELGFATLYLHYNTGKHISHNGKELSLLLSKLVKQDVSLNVVAHSMGGLLIRSSCYYAQKTKQKWLEKLDKIVFLGTPHHGALLEKSGNWINVLLKISPYTQPFTKITNVRSSGITDLRYGNIIDEDWNNHERFEHKGDQRNFTSLPKGVTCYAVATTVSQKKSSVIADDIIGDGLVTINSALGIHKELDLKIPKTNQWIGRDINHNQLLSDVKVYKVIKNWMSD